MVHASRNVALIAVLCVCSSPGTLAQTSAAAISGQVLAADSDTPLRRARISITAGTWRSDVVLTDNDGRFVIEVPAAGPRIPFTVTIAKGGFVTAAVRVERDDTPTPLVVRPLRGAAIAGIVVDRNGALAAGMGVTATRIAGTDAGTPTQYSTTTDDLGEYRLAGLARGRYEIWAGSATMITVIPPLPSGSKVQPIQRQVGAPQKTTLTVETAEELGGVQLVAPDLSAAEAAVRALRESGLPPNSTVTVQTNLSGVVLNEPPSGVAKPAPGRAAVLSGRVLSAGRGPVAAASVRIEGPGVDRAVRTDATGAFSAALLAPGQYTVRADVSDRMSWHYGQRASGEAGRPINVARDQVVQGIELVSLPPARFPGSSSTSTAKRYRAHVSRHGSCVTPADARWPSPSATRA
jgi:hypothetical protein